VHLATPRGTFSRVPHDFPPIGLMKTAFTEKLGVPRQANLVPAARGVLKLNPDPRYLEAVNQLDTFTHIWILFVFDRGANQEWRPRIEPPRADGPRTVGVFASRSPRRPNPIGMSAVKLERIDLDAAGGIEIHVSGVDLLDGTPVLDVKPYLPYADSIPEAGAGWAHERIDRLPVSFVPGIILPPERLELLRQILALDPRPTPQRRSMPARDPANYRKVFRFRWEEFDVEWRLDQEGIAVLRLLPL
jgi:tRNA-Thr(GGU) m(6)t(6)A37 methyltransferase TsaA